MAISIVGLKTFCSFQELEGKKKKRKSPEPRWNTIQSSNLVYFQNIRAFIDRLISATIVHAVSYYVLLLDSERLVLWLTILDNT